MTFTCIRPGCGRTYDSEDAEAYYCPNCLKQRSHIIAEVDKKVGSTVGQVPHGFNEAIEKLPKYKGMTFIK